jgi:hypothetical protein
MSHLSLLKSSAPVTAKQRTLIDRIWREASRPFRPRTWRKSTASVPAPQRSLNSVDFRFDLGTVEPEGLALLQRLVETSRQYPGPIVEIGTLFGATATHMALFKSPEQKIITVDTYTWNPWGLSQQTHYELTGRILFYLVQTGQVEQVNQDKNLFYATYRGPAPSLVFLDAVHTYEETKKDIEWAKSVGAKLIAGHDYSAEFPGVQQIVREHGGPKELGGTVFLVP